MDYWLRNAKVTLISLVVTDGVEETSGVTELDGENIRIVFNITKTTRGIPNSGSIDLYNLNNDTQQLLDSRDLNVVLSAGWVGSMSNIFSGQLMQTELITQGVDTIHRLWLRDGFRDWSQTRVNKAYRGTTPLIDVVTELANKFSNIDGVDFTEAPLLSASEVKLKNFVTTGLVHSTLDDLASGYDFTYSIQDNTMHFVDTNRIVSRDDTLIVNSSTPLMGQLVKDYTGITFKIPLDTTFMPTRSIQVDVDTFKGNYGNYILLSKDFELTKGTQGLYNIFSSNFQGDTYGQMWQVEVMAHGFSGATNA